MTEFALYLWLAVYTKIDLRQALNPKIHVDWSPINRLAIPGIPRAAADWPQITSTLQVAGPPKAVGSSPICGHLNGNNNAPGLIVGQAFTIAGVADRTTGDVAY